MGLSFRREFRRRQEDDEALAKFVHQGLEAENYVLADGEQALTQLRPFTAMPRACFELRVLSRMVPLSEVPSQILQATHYRRRA